MRDIGRTAVTELFRILKMTLRVIFSSLKNLSLRRNIYLSIRKFTRETNLFSGKSELQMFFPVSGRHVGFPSEGHQHSVPILS